MPATPPVGNGLRRAVLKVAVSCSVAVAPGLEKLWIAVPMGWSVLFQVRLVVHRASNLDRARSMLAPIVAGSRARTRMESVEVMPPPVNETSLSW